MHSPEAIWPIFGRHLFRYREPGLVRAADLGPGRFVALTGVPDIELNVTGLHPPAGPDEAAAVVDLIDRTETPALVFVSGDTHPSVLAVLAERGFTPTTWPEPLMWRDGSVRPVPDATFTVRRVTAEPDLAALTRILADAITMPAEVTRRQFALERLVEDGLGVWIAWDGDEPISSVTLTWEAEACAVWEMMTVPAHRRRGAGRAVLSAALSAVMRPSMAGTVLVSTPFGRPMYEALGFVAVDESITWTRGASAADLARIGQTPAAIG